MNLTIYSVTADLTLLRAVLNGVAMICNQTNFIWGFAIMVCMWNITRAVVGATIQSAGNGSTPLVTGAFNVLLPLIFAMMLTAPGLKSSVTLQSTINGRVAVVDNVPTAIAILPATASVMSQELGTLVGTAFQTTGTDYASISASGNGFINPLKVMLTARTAILRMGSLDSQIRTVVGACITADAGSNFAEAIDKVTYAGNFTSASASSPQGARRTESIDIRGVGPTTIGALLYQASLNTTGFVNDIQTSSQDILSCSAAAQYVATQITEALDSREFSRVVQGAVNGMDQPIPTADFSFANVTAQYQAIRTSQKVLTDLANGATQANSEIINLLFAESVQGNLNCLKTDANNRTTCQAANIQALEIERNNIQRAANEVAMLKYAGAFANYMMALIIGLGPIIIMFMMFSGVGATRSMFVAAHVVVWPILVLNVGAELVNGMICIQVANFLDSIAQGGYINQSTAIEAYKQFGIQVGTASHIMASLPVLLSMIFALGASSAMVTVAQGMTPKGTDVGTGMVPRAMNAAPLVNSSAMANVSQGNGFNVYRATGALEQANAQATFGSLGNEVARTSQAQTNTQRVVTQAQSFNQSIIEGDAVELAKRWGVSEEKARSIRNGITNQRETADTTGNSTTHAEDKKNSTSAQANMQAGVGVGLGSILGLPVPKPSIDLSATGRIGTDSSDTTSRSKKENVENTQRDSAAITKGLEKTISKAQRDGLDESSVNAIRKDLTQAEAFTTQLSQTDSLTNASASAAKASSTFVAFANSMNTAAIAHAATHNPAMMRFHTGAAREWADSPHAQQYMNTVKGLVESGAVDVVGMGSFQARAVMNHAALAQAAADPKAPQEVRQQAIDLLVAQSAAMTGHSSDFKNPTPLNGLSVSETDKPMNDTGLLPGQLKGRFDKKGELIPNLPKRPTPPVVPIGKLTMPTAPSSNETPAGRSPGPSPGQEVNNKFDGDPATRVVGNIGEGLKNFFK